MPSLDGYTTSSEGSITRASVIAVGAVLPGLATIAVTMRFVARSFEIAPFGMDDTFILIALVRRPPRQLHRARNTCIDHK